MQQSQRQRQRGDLDLLLPWTELEQSLGEGAAVVGDRDGEQGRLELAAGAAELEEGM
jgi:hypothetical protein